MSLDEITRITLNSPCGATPEVRNYWVGEILLLQFGGTVSSEQTRDQSDQTFCFHLLFVQACDSPLTRGEFLYGSLIFRLWGIRVVVDSTHSRHILCRICLGIALLSLLLAMQCWRSVSHGANSLLESFYGSSTEFQFSWLVRDPLNKYFGSNFRTTLRSVRSQFQAWTIKHPCGGIPVLFDQDLIAGNGGYQSSSLKIGGFSPALFSGLHCWMSVFTQQWLAWCILHRPL